MYKNASKKNFYTTIMHNSGKKPLLCLLYLIDYTTKERTVQRKFQKNSTKNLQLPILCDNCTFFCAICRKALLLCNKIYGIILARKG